MKLRRVLWFTLGALLALGSRACGPLPQYAATADRGPEVVADTAFRQMVGQLRERFYGHRVLPDREFGFCVYGIARPDTIFVAFVQPTLLLHQTADRLRYLPCREADPRFGALRYLGMWHTHADYAGIDGCWFSELDRESFAADPRAVVDLVSCRRGLIAITKPP